MTADRHDEPADPFRTAELRASGAGGLDRLARPVP